MRKLIYTFIILSFLPVFAQQVSSNEIQSRIENNQYVGGIDEEKLKEQKELKPPVRYLNLKRIRKEVYAQVLKEANEATEEDNAPLKESQM